MPRLLAPGDSLPARAQPDTRRLRTVPASGLGNCQGLRGGIKQMKPIQYEDSAKHFHKPGTERLTAYEFACGYVQHAERGMQHDPENLAPTAGVSLTLWKEHGTFHVRAHDFGKHERLFWDSF